MPTASQVTDAILIFCEHHGVPVTPLGLQKLLYYVQAWHLALKGEPMFEGGFEAWVHGPVHRPTWERFRHLPRNAVINEPVESPKFSIDKYRHIVDVLDSYSHLNAFELEQKTHQELPWREARGESADDERCTEVISETTMRDYYRSMLVEESVA